MHVFHGVLKMNSELGVGKEQYTANFRGVFMPINKALLTSSLEEEKNWAMYKEFAFLQPPS